MARKFKAEEPEDLVSLSGGPSEPTKLMPSPSDPPAEYLAMSEMFHEEGPYASAMLRRQMKASYSFTKLQKRIARRFYGWLMGARSPFRVTYMAKDGKKRVSVDGIIDPSLSRLCRKGSPRHYTRGAWEQHLKGDYHNRLSKLKILDILIHLFGVPSQDPRGLERRVYYVGHSNWDSKHLLICLDLDDKQEKGTIRRLWGRVRRSFPLLDRDGYIEHSPGGYGIHVYLVLNHEGVPKPRVNDVLKKLAGHIRHTTARRSDRKTAPIVDNIKGTASYYDSQIIAFDEESNYIWWDKKPEHMGTMASLPRPQNEAELEQVMGLPNVAFPELESLLPDSFLVNQVTTEPTVQPDPKGDQQALGNTPPASIIKLCSSYGVEYNTQNDSTSVNESSSSQSSLSGSERNTSRMTVKKSQVFRDVADGFERKKMYVRWLARSLGRVPTPKEAHDGYIKCGLSGNRKKDPAKREKDMAAAIEWTARTFKPDIRGISSFRPADYEFIDEIDLAPATHCMPAGRSERAVRETLKVFLHLVEKSVVETPEYRFTVGIKRIETCIRRLRQEQPTTKATTNRSVVSAVRKIACALGLAELTQNYYEGQACRYILAPKHPRYQEFAERWLLRPTEEPL